MMEGETFFTDLLKTISRHTKKSEIDWVFDDVKLDDFSAEEFDMRLVKLMISIIRRDKTAGLQLAKFLPLTCSLINKHLHCKLYHSEKYFRNRHKLINYYSPPPPRVRN